MWGHLARLANNKIFYHHQTINKNIFQQTSNLEEGLENSYDGDKYGLNHQFSFPQISEFQADKKNKKQYIPPIYYGMDAESFEVNKIKEVYFSELSDEKPQKNESESAKERTKPEYLPKIKLYDEKSLQISEFQANNPSEDRIVSQQLTSIDALAISVFDGHGGYKMADYASKMVHDLIDIRLKKYLSNGQSLSKEISENIIKQSITWAYQQIEKNFFCILEGQFKPGNKEILKVGSCGITAILYEDKIFVANCGDSQAIVLTEDSFDTMGFFQCNERLSVNLQSERKRLKEEFHEKDPQILVKDQHNRNYLKGVLQPTKSLGDYYLKKEKYYNKLGSFDGTFKGPYLNCNPIFTVIQITGDFKYFLIASDGLWDFLSKKQILSEVSKLNEEFKANNSEPKDIFVDLNKTYLETSPNKNDRNIAQNIKSCILEKCAAKKNLSVEQLLKVDLEEMRNYCDDISLALLRFNHPEVNIPKKFSL